MMLSAQQYSRFWRENPGGDGGYTEVENGQCEILRKRERENFQKGSRYEIQS